MGKCPAHRDFCPHDNAAMLGGVDQAPHRDLPMRLTMLALGHGLRCIRPRRGASSTCGHLAG
jgi:hypothetical protein